MKADHICGGHVYLISNFGVARNPIFCDSLDVEFFRSNVEKYLGKLCVIHAYHFKHNQFQILIRIKWRNLIEAFFERKYENGTNSKFSQLILARKNGNSGIEYPETYRIFSQEISNMLNSYAKYFNFKYKRTGGLFGSRYTKILVESEQEMINWVERLNSGAQLVLFKKEWSVKESFVMNNASGEENSKIFYKRCGRNNFHTIFSNFWLYYIEDLRGCFNSLPPANIRKQNLIPFWLNFLKINNYNPPW